MVNKLNKIHSESVKIYFIEPIHLISVVIDTLIKLNFEAYSIEGVYKDKLLSILKANARNVIYICVLGDTSVDEWLDYIDKLQGIEQSRIQVGAFIFNKMPLELRTQFLERGIATIPFENLKYNTLETLKKILTYLPIFMITTPMKSWLKSMSGKVAFIPTPMVVISSL